MSMVIKCRLVLRGGMVLESYWDAKPDAATLVKNLEAENAGGAGIIGGLYEEAVILFKAGRYTLTPYKVNSTEAARPQANADGIIINARN